jgi:hypothetical protein
MKLIGSSGVLHQELRFALRLRCPLPTFSVGRPFRAAGRLESLPHRERLSNPPLDGRGRGRVDSERSSMHLTVGQIRQRLSNRSANLPRTHGYAPILDSTGDGVLFPHLCSRMAITAADIP